MIYKLQNEMLTVEISDYGAELQSIKNTQGKEFLWQGNQVCKDHAPNLFPYIGRLYESKYLFRNREYHLPMHGFANTSVFQAVKHTEEECVFELRSTMETKVMYPFEFVYQITYRLCGNTIKITNHVKNLDQRMMYFGLGGHPYFNLPMDEGLQFEDYYLEFEHERDAELLNIASDRLYEGTNRKAPLENGRRFRLHYDLFEENAIVFEDMDKQVTLKSDKGTHRIVLSYPDMRNLGVWTMQKMHFPFLCIEPWTSAFGRSGRVEDISNQKNLIPLSAGSEYKNKWSITVY